MNTNPLLNLLTLWIPKGWATAAALAAFGLLTTLFAIDMGKNDKPETEAIETAILSLTTYGVIFGWIVTIGGAGLKRAMDAAAQPKPPTQ